MDKNEINNTILQNIKSIRKQLNLTQKELSEQIGITFQMWQKYERNKVSINLTKLIAICLYFKEKGINNPFAIILKDTCFETKKSELKLELQLINKKLELLMQNNNN